MLEDFLTTWDLFQHAYLVGWLSSVLLAPIGVIVVARNQIFLSAAGDEPNVGIGGFACDEVLKAFQAWKTERY